ncbi:MAG: hypothetical protein HYY05_06120 [Chloroflexi bacterium]|nr:hypothetical protein [Chloroflexota bacterium]
MEGLLSLPERGPAGETPALPAGPYTGVVICHPHPLRGGDMHNNVVAALALGFAQSGLATLRFNFRGVGASQGSYDDGRGEREDARAALRFLAERVASRQWPVASRTPPSPSPLRQAQGRLFPPGRGEDRNLKLETRNWPWRAIPLARAWPWRWQPMSRWSGP